MSLLYYCNIILLLLVLYFTVITVTCYDSLGLWVTLVDDIRILGLIEKERYNIMITRIALTGTRRVFIFQVRKERNLQVWSCLPESR